MLITARDFLNYHRDYINTPGKYIWVVTFEDIQNQTAKRVLEMARRVEELAPENLERISICFSPEVASKEYRRRFLLNEIATLATEAQVGVFHFHDANGYELVRLETAFASMVGTEAAARRLAPLAGGVGDAAVIKQLTSLTADKNLPQSSTEPPPPGDVK